MSDGLPFALDRYQLTEKIGAGAMGIVYKGLDPLIGRPVAVKLIRTDLLDESHRDEYRVRFRQEVRAAGCCVHPGIVTVYDYAERDGDPYIVMEYVAGRMLQQLFGKGRLPVEQAVDITLQLLAALGHAHAQGVVHRDIKPANIIIGPGLRVKITDFGIARMEASALTNVGALLGTPNYMAPEQARGERVDHRADLFSVGVIFLRMLTGALPYGDDSFAAVLQKMAAPDPINISALDAIEPRLAAVATLALAKTPAARFQSAEEFEHLLRAMTVEHSGAEIRPGMAIDPDPSAGPPLPEPAETAPPALAPAAVTHGSWSSDLMAQLQLALAKHVGPIAVVLAARAAAASTTLDELIQVLCLAIGSEPERASFADAARAIASPGPPPPSLAQTGTVDAEAGRLPTGVQVVPIGVMSSAQALLARYIGPIARLLVRQSSLEVQSLDEFSNRLASHIAEDEERTRFKRDLTALINHPERHTDPAAGCKTRHPGRRQRMR